MQHAATLSAVLFSGILFIPAGAKAQSHTSASSSTTPVWVEHTWEEGSHVLPYAIDVNDEVYVTKVVQDTAYHYFCEEGESYCVQGSFVYIQGNFIVSYDTDGSLRWERPGSAPREETRFFNTFVGYGVAAWDDRIYTNDGTPYIRYPSNEYYVSHGGIMINTYADDGDSLQTIFLGDDPTDIPPAAINGLGFDRAGNIYFAGMYDGDRYRYEYTLFPAPHTLDPFLPTGINELGNPEIFLASYTPEGVIRWTRRMGGGSPDLLEEGLFAVDGDGNTYLLGEFRGDAVFGEGQPNEVRFPEESFLAYALASFNAEGDLRWVRTESGLGFDHSGIEPHRLAVDAAGRLLISWRGPKTGGGYGRYAATITKLSQDGALLWNQRLLADDVHISGITTDAQGHVYVGGSFSGGPLRLGDTVLHSPDHAQPPGEDGFVAHYDADGNLRWVGHATGPGAQDITAIAVGPSGDLYVAGKFDRALYLGPDKLEQRGGGSNMFVAKYDAATITSSETAPELPSTATLTSNYPNPFTHATTIEYALPASGRVHLSVYDVLGREVATLVDGVQHAGKHASVFDGTSLPSGTYFYRLKAAGQARTGLMTLMK